MLKIVHGGYDYDCSVDSGFDCRFDCIDITRGLFVISIPNALE
jgi:hypothetical protein